MDSNPRSWGGHSILLQLPVCRVLIEGLSLLQHQAIFRNYKSFAASGKESARKVDVVCHADRLDHPPEFSPDAFTVNTQYSPLKKRYGARIEITGFGFRGCFFRGRNLPVKSSLSVFKEADFSQPGVLENFLRPLVAHLALDHGGVLLHSVGVLHRERAFLFSGRSNAGKTTLARKAAAAGYRVLSDDINLVSEVNGGFWAHKVPFTGEFGHQIENLSGSGAFPLGGLALLEKTSTLTSALVSPATGIAGLLAGSPYVNDDPEEFPALLGVLTRLVRQFPLVRLGAALDDAFESLMDSLLNSYQNV